MEATVFSHTQNTVPDINIRAEEENVESGGGVSASLGSFRPASWELWLTVNSLVGLGTQAFSLKDLKHKSSCVSFGFCDIGIVA